jgi:xylan 1,4-beta-xylosidase
MREMKPLFTALILMLSFENVIAQTRKEVAIQEKHTITVEADNVVGEVYNLWDVRVINAPERWGEEGFAANVQATSKHIKYINNVRSLGGKHNDECAWFKGVDDKGEPICDFEPFIGYMKAQLSVGYTPWIVLDNVPNKMSNTSKHQYGNCSPPDDYDVWFKYIQQFIQALVDEFGKEQVSQWHFRVGTEPDLFPNHWAGTKEEYFKHYDYTVAAVESIINEPIIGPGNMLMWNGTQEGKKGGRWGFGILEHCADGTNYYTGNRGTRIKFFSQSVYARSPKPFEFETNMKKLKAELAKYESLKDLDYEIHENGELMAALSRGDAVKNLEYFVGLYAHTVELAYDYNVRRVFNWDQHFGKVPTWDQIVVGLFHPWTKVTDCLTIIEGGQRVKVLKDGEKDLKFGAIAAWKEGSFYVLIYSHHDDKDQELENSIDLTLVGERFAQVPLWSVDEQLLDKENGIYIHELYKDIEAEGILPLETNLNFQRNLELRYGTENQPAAAAIAQKNLRKYQQMSEMKQLKSGEHMETKNGKINFKLNFEGSGFRFIKLTPF